MKNLKRFLLLLLIALAIAVYMNYPKLNILSGYSAKYMNSSVFVADRTADFTDNHDLTFSPINLATDEVDSPTKTSNASSFGLLTREAIYREGLGSVLILDEEDKTSDYLVPKRAKADNITPFPYGNGEQKDTVFANIDYKKLNETVNSVFSDSAKTRAVLVVYKNQIIAEKYSDGFDKNSKILGWSMTKSITGTLFGILQHQGKLDVQSKPNFKEWQNDERKNITIHNLLQMNSGLEWDENYDKISDATKMLFLSRNMGNVQRDKPLAGKPNESWNYSSGTTNLLSNILRMQFKTHQEYLDFWYTDLIDKIDMNSMLIETDLDGNYVGSSYAWATARDWSKFGLLYLHNGNWNGQQLFDKKWVDYATTPTPTSVNAVEGGYGAQIWLNTGKRYPNVPTNMYSFNGYQGQYVFVLPEQDLVIVRMGLTKKVDFDSLISGVISAIKE